MNGIFITADELFVELKKAYKKGMKVDIATYSMYIGISKGHDNSFKYPSTVRNFINVIEPTDLRIVVGLPYFMECKPDCMDCAIKYNTSLDRFVDTQQVLGMEMKFHSTTHFKFYQIGDRIFTGGINLTGSAWIDIAMEITDLKQKAELRGVFDKTWNGAMTSLEVFKK